MVTGSECSLVEPNAQKLQWSHPKNPSIQDKLNNTKTLTTHDFWVLSELSLYFYPDVMQEETAGFVLPSAVGIIPSLVELKQKRSWKLVLANLKSSLCGSLLNTKRTTATDCSWARSKDLLKWCSSSTSDYIQDLLTTEAKPIASLTPAKKQSTTP